MRVEVGTKEIITGITEGDEVEIVIDGETVFYVMDGEVEDNVLARNFQDVYKIASLLERAYNAGKNGEDFSIEKVTLV